MTEIRSYAVLSKILTPVELGRLFPLHGKTILVTGAASERGLGRAMVQEACLSGARGVIADKKGAEVAAEELRNQGLDVIGVELDVTDFAQCQEVMDFVAAKYGLYGIVANAGISLDDRILNQPIEDYLEVVNVVQNGSWYTAKAAMPHLMRAKLGRIVFISSVIGLVGKVQLSAYAAAKGALIPLARSLAQEAGKFDRDITVNVVAPGYCDTDILRRLLAEQKAALAERSVFNRLGTKEEVAGAVVHLTLPGTSYTTGMVYVVDGGYTLL